MGFLGHFRAACPSPSPAGSLSKLQVGGHQEAKRLTRKPQEGFEASQASAVDGAPRRGRVPGGQCGLARRRQHGGFSSASGEAEGLTSEGGCEGAESERLCA